MAAHPTGKDVAGALAPAFVLDRVDAIPKLVGRHEDFLIVTGLAPPKSALLGRRVDRTTGTGKNSRADIGGSNAARKCPLLTAPQCRTAAR